MKRVFAILLTVVMLAAMLCGCSAKGKLRGTWQATADLSGVMQRVLAESWPDSVYQVKDFQVVLELTFQKNGTCAFRLQETSLQYALEALQAAMEQDFIDSICNRLTEMNKNVTLDEVLKATGVSLDSMRRDFKTTFQGAEFDRVLRDKLSFNGYFKPDGEKLYISATEEIPEDSFAFVYQIKDGVLTMPMIYGTAPMDAAIPAVIAPLSFQKG